MSWSLPVRSQASCADALTYARAFGRELALPSPASPTAQALLDRGHRHIPQLQAHPQRLLRRTEVPAMSADGIDRRVPEGQLGKGEGHRDDNCTFIQYHPVNGELL